MGAGGGLDAAAAGRGYGACVVRCERFFVVLVWFWRVVGVGCRQSNSRHAREPRRRARRRRRCSVGGEMQPSSSVCGVPHDHASGFMEAPSTESTDAHPRSLSLGWLDGECPDRGQPLLGLPLAAIFIAFRSRPPARLITASHAHCPLIYFMQFTHLPPGKPLVAGRRIASPSCPPLSLSPCSDATHECRALPR